MTVTSLDNARVKAYAKLKTARERRRTRLFLIEGHREVERAADAGVQFETLIVCESLLGRSLLRATAPDIFTVAEAPMRKIAIRENPPGVIAVAHQFETGLSDLSLGDDPLLLIAEHVEKPGNLGAMMRTCDAVGVDAMIVADPATDVFNPNVVRASQGAFFSVPLAVAATSDVIAWCQEREISVVGGYPAASNELWQTRMRGAAAVLVGAEDTGISATWDDVATPVRIPMAGAADSLNASVSAAILLFEAVRQRR